MPLGLRGSDVVGAAGSMQLHGHAVRAVPQSTSAKQNVQFICALTVVKR
jgi:hypothetical protein